MPIGAPSTDARSRRDLAIASMNRGHALMLRGDVPSLTSALEAYDEAISQLRPLLVTLEAEPSWANSLGAALMNRGQLLHRLHGVTQASAALETFTKADAVLRPLAQQGHLWARRNLTGTLLNRANLLLDLGDFPQARADAHKSLTLAASTELTDVIDADLALKARRALCDALGHLLVGARDIEDDLATEASDHVDDSLALIRHWQTCGTNFPELALRFFRFGAQLYRLHQPHFLAEFIRENLPADDAEFHAVTLDAIEATLRDGLHMHPRLTIGDAASERHVRTARGLENLRREISSPAPSAGIPA